VTKDWRLRYESLPPDRSGALVSAITVADQQPQLADIGMALRDEFRPVVRAEHLDAFVERRFSTAPPPAARGDRLREPQRTLGPSSDARMLTQSEALLPTSSRTGLHASRGVVLFQFGWSAVHADSAVSRFVPGFPGSEGSTITLPLWRLSGPRACARSASGMRSLMSSWSLSFPEATTVRAA
jgi:hypothetical protein